MIVPGLASPLRPVLRAYYTTTHQVGPDAAPATCLQTLQDALSEANLTINTTAPQPLDLIVEGRIGVAVLPLPALLTAKAIRRQVRQCLTAEQNLEVALLIAFTPRPRVARINAPHPDLPPETSS